MDRTGQGGSSLLVLCGAELWSEIQHGEELRRAAAVFAARDRRHVVRGRARHPPPGAHSQGHPAAALARRRRSALEQLRRLEPASLDVVALGRQRAPRVVELSQAPVIGGRVRHLLVQLRLAGAEAIE
jgi:hypothetical protein